jgi:hypothetical protein
MPESDLDAEQKDLLARMVELTLELPRESRAPFVLSRTLPSSFLGHPRLYTSDSRIPANGNDLSTLAEHGLLRESFGSNGNRLFEVTNVGFRYQQAMAAAAPERGVEALMATFLDGQAFAARYPVSYARWKKVTAELWADRADSAVSLIGHQCRELLQAFATELIATYQPANPPADVTKTVDRLRSVVEGQGGRLGKTDSQFLLALVGYWGAVSDLAQKAEHSGVRESEPLRWEDGRRLVFQTGILMFEVDRALTP